jgi:hypothetical protein
METVAQMIAILETAIDADGNIIPGAAAKYRSIGPLFTALRPIEPGIVAGIDHIIVSEHRLPVLIGNLLTFLRNV